MFHFTHSKKLVGVDFNSSQKYLVFDAPSKNLTINDCGIVDHLPEFPKNYVFALALPETQVMVHTQDFPPHLSSEAVICLLKEQIDHLFPGSTDTIGHHRFIRRNHACQTWSIAVTLSSRIEALRCRLPIAAMRENLAFIDTVGDALWRCIQQCWKESLPTHFGILFFEANDYHAYAVCDDQLCFRYVIRAENAVVACQQLQALAMMYLPFFAPTYWMITGSQATTVSEEALAAVFGVPVILFNPLREINAHPAITHLSAMIQQGYALSVACGLALREIDA